MTHSGNFGNIFGNGVFDLWSQGLFVKKCLAEDEPGVDPLGVEPLGVDPLGVEVGVNLGVNLGNDMKESAEDADDFADGDDMELELFDRDVGLLQTLVIGDKRCLKSEIWNSLSNLVNALLKDSKFQKKQVFLFSFAPKWTKLCLIPALRI